MPFQGKRKQLGPAQAIEITGIAHEFVRCYHSDSAFDALDGTRYVRSRNV